MDDFAVGGMEFMLGNLLLLCYCRLAPNREVGAAAGVKCQDLWQILIWIGWILIYTRETEAALATFFCVSSAKHNKKLYRAIIEPTI